ncbi:GNAT family N-acetyltransferase [Falsiroseomonas sp. HW251]|uniref:GNAT family N-acetyltransferase n=1 Tax=Falsiroseomonas sp. HW251 TaxID=3390998 RepID=UPI003D3137AB
MQAIDGAHAVTDNATGHRFEMPVGDEVAFVEYRRDGATLVLTHTEVPEALNGQGVGSRLARGVLDLLRAQGRRAASECSFVNAYVKRHPDYRDVVEPRG